MTMPKEKRTIAKWFLYILPIILILIIVFTVIGYKRDSADLERQSRAALKKLLSCTLQQAEDFDAAAETTQAVMESAAAGGTGLTQDDKLQDYLIEQFSDSMTEACIEELAMNRTFYQSIALIKQFNSAIEASEIELVQCAGEQKGYSFSAELKTSAGDSVAAAKGIISMKKDEDRWKASHITLTIIQSY